MSFSGISRLTSKAGFDRKTCKLFLGRAIYSKRGTEFGFTASTSCDLLFGETVSDVGKEFYQ